MKNNKLSLLQIAAAVGLFAASAFGQTGVFADPNAEYTFAIPDAAWKMTAKPSSTSPNVEYVYGDRSDGALEVRRMTVPANRLLTDVIHQDEEVKLQFRPGFVAGREENFSGKLRGSVYNFEYVASGRAMAGRFYFLRANDTTVYLLKFSGPKDTMRSIRPQMDSIARTFGVK